MSLSKANFLAPGVVALALLGSATSARASEAHVTIVDTDGVPIPDVSISLRCGADAALETQTDAVGRAEYRDLAPGDCRLDASHPTLGVATTEVHLTADGSLDVELVLGAQTNVSVVASRRGSPLSKEMLKNLPLGRGYQSGLQVTSGVVGGANPSMAGGASNENTYVPPGFVGSVLAERDALSTFAIDVDTASYAVTRGQLSRGSLPDPDSVRVEEFINTFPYEYSPPRLEQPLGIHTEAAPHPLRPEAVLFSVALTSPDAPLRRDPLHLTFLVDVSGSMGSSDKIGLVRESLHTLVDGLEPADQIALATYAGDTRVVLPPTAAGQRRQIHDAIDDLQTGGGTAMGDGIALAYQQALAMSSNTAEDRVIVLTDGDGNIGQSSTDALVDIVAGYAGKGIGLSVLGFGQRTFRDARLEKLADTGDGNYHFIDGSEEAKRVFGRDLIANLTTVARDVKVQVEFPPESVLSWRQIGYENRAVADADFRDNSVDGGEVGYGHQVTALYELILRNKPHGPLATVHVRAEPPGVEAPAVEFVSTHKADDVRESWASASRALRWASAAATFAEVLRASPFESETSWSDVLRLVDGAADPDRDDHRELVELAESAAKLAGHARAQVGATGGAGRSRTSPTTLSSSPIDPSK